MKLRSFLVTGLAGLGVSLSAPLRADVSVDVANCAWSVQELRRLVRLELADVTATSQQSERYQTGVECEGDTVLLWINDPLTRKRIQRKVEAPPPAHPEPERLIALTLAQLYRASWLELIAEDESPLPPAEPPPRAAEAKSAARGAVRRVVRASDQAWFVGLGGEAQLRPLDAPQGFLGLSPGAGWSPIPSFYLQLRLNGSSATVERASGDVDVQVLGAQLGAAWKHGFEREWFGWYEGLSGPSYVRLQGSRVDADYQAATVSGWALSTLVGAGVGRRLGAFDVVLVAQLGLLLGAPAGKVADDDAVRADGAWLGGSLRFRWNHPPR